MIAIRTDANTHIAGGHLMRCLAIARQVKKLGAEVCFLLSDEESRRELLLHQDSPEEFACEVLLSDYQNPEGELPVLLAFLKKQKPECLLIDSYFVTEPYLKTLKGKVRTMYLDDLQSFDYPVDEVINYDPEVNTDIYQSAGSFYCGTAYAPLREDFERGGYQTRDRVQDVLLSTGSTDKAGFLLSFLDYAWKQPEEITFHVLTGSMYAFKEELSRLADGKKRLILHENVRQVAELMKSCDAAVSAGGGTLYELCAVGVPALGFSVSDTQLPCLKAFDKAGIVPYMGKAGDPELISNIYAKLMELSSNLTLRQQRSKKERTAVDGQGSRRIARILLKQEEKSCKKKSVR